MFRDNETKMLMSPLFSLATPSALSVGIVLLKFATFSSWGSGFSCNTYVSSTKPNTDVWYWILLQVSCVLLLMTIKEKHPCYRWGFNSAERPPPHLQTLLMAIPTRPPFHVHSREGRADRLTDCQPNSIFLFCHSFSPRWNPTLLSPKQNRFSISTP